MTKIDEAALKDLREGFEGTVVVPGDATYDDDRTLFNTMIDRKPAVIAKPTTTDSVAKSIAWARDKGVEIGVRSGGHGVLGLALADGGLTIDMRALNKVSVDPDARVARVEGGATWGVFDKATMAHGLGATGGRVSTTGIAGLTLGGGSGWIERKYGLACDNLRAVEIMTADGEIVRASDDENTDLFWALRGGGGNFGIATALEFNLHRFGPEIFAALMLYDQDVAEELARNYRDFIDAGAPEEIGGGIAFLTAPPEDFVPAERQGKVHVGQIITWCGPVDQAEKACAPLLQFGSPAVNLSMPVPYDFFQSMLDDPPGFRNYWTAEYTDTLPDEGIEIWARYGREQRPSPTQLVWFPWGGAVGRGPDTAMSARDANWVFHPLGLWESADDDEWWINWARSARREVGAFGIGTAYLNFSADVTSDSVPEAFGSRFERLARIKASYDPENIFHLNNNIAPNT